MTEDMNYINPHTKLLWHIDRLALIKDGEQPAPVNVEIDLTNRCQLGCSFCSFAYTHSAGLHSRKRTHDTGDIMDYELAISIVDQLAKAGVRSITYSGGGEPTLHPDIVKIVSYAHSLGIDQGIYTNGLRLDNMALHEEFGENIPDDIKVLPAVLKHTMKWVYLSHGSRGLHGLLEAEGDATVGVGMLVDSRNISDIYDYALLAANADYFHIRPIVGGSILETEIELIDAIVKVIRYKGVNVIYNRDRFYTLLNWDGHKFDTCYWPQVQSIITPDGRVWVCSKRRGFEDSCLGELSKQTWEAVWSNSRAWQVDDNCPKKCRGYIPNRIISEMYAERDHANFI